MLLLFPGDADLDVLTALLEESESVREEQDPEEQEDDLDGLFDEDNNEDEEYKDGLEGEGQEVGSGDSVSELFGDVEDIENEETKGKKSMRRYSKSLDRSKEDLQGLFFLVFWFFLLLLFRDILELFFMFTSVAVMILLFSRWAEANAGEDAAVATTAGSNPESSLSH